MPEEAPQKKQKKETLIFQRVEKKYLLTREQYLLLLREFSDHLIPDEHGRSRICNLYLDTPDFRLIRTSIDAKVYKEKLRLRSYGIPGADDKVFLEIKKKFKGIVYKRRVSLPRRQAEDYILAGKMPADSQIMREIDYAMHFWNFPKPAMMINYDREAYFFKESPALRLTFDTDIRYRVEDVSYDGGSGGVPILPEDAVLMEFKTDGAMPMWMSAVLNREGIFRRKFSKYGTAYQQMTSQKQQKTETTERDHASCSIP